MTATNMCSNFVGFRSSPPKNTACFSNLFQVQSPQEYSFCFSNLMVSENNSYIHLNNFLFDFLSQETLQKYQDNNYENLS